jgi:two-component system CheB/CheR fusion protein
LFLGGAETIGEFTDLFAPLGGKSRLFRRSESLQRSETLVFPSSFRASTPSGNDPLMISKPATTLQSLADELVLKQYAPPAVLTNDAGDIVYVSGRTGRYLEPASGKANWNIFVMARDGLRYELARAFSRAIGEKSSVCVKGLKVILDGGPQFVDVTIQKIHEPDPLRGLMMIVFADAQPPTATRSSVKAARQQGRNPKFAEMEQELVKIRAEARATHEEMQTSQEELRSANEELQSTNEELQSTNEELTTSKEEMQSMNEELQTVNAELQARVDELSRAGNDMKNLLDSTDIATLFLDKDLNVRRFTPQATKIIKFVPTDVGRPITDLASDLAYSDLAADAREVLRKLAPMEKPVSSRDGRWFSVRIMPYRTQEDRIDGVVITFANITDSKVLEARLRKGQSVREAGGSPKVKPSLSKRGTPPKKARKRKLIPPPNPS